MKLPPVGSFKQNESDVIKLLKRKMRRKKLSKLGKEFLKTKIKK